MRHEQEMIRWAKSHEGTRVWVLVPMDGWNLLTNPNWESGATYIVDDCHAELRKLQITEPDTEFEFNEGTGWEYCGVPPSWFTETKYRVKPALLWYDNLPEHNVLCWVSDRHLKEKKQVSLITEYSLCSFKTPTGARWNHATPLTTAESQQLTYKEH